MWKFFYYPNACSRAAHIALHEAGAAFEPVRVDLPGGEQRQEQYLAINPKGRVPALATERGVLTENPAILAFIAQSFPDAKLAPLDDPFAFAQMQAFNGYLSSTVHVAHAHKGRGYRWADDPAAIAEMKRKVPETVGTCFEQVERDFFVGPWVLGEVYSVADPYLFTLFGWAAGDGVDPARFPRLQDHARRMAERPAVRRALEAEQ